MIRIDDLEIFSSGPCSLGVGPWRRDMERRVFPGIDGELLLDMGLRSRTMIQTGRLQASSSALLRALVDELLAIDVGKIHALTDNLGRTYTNVVVEDILPTSPVCGPAGAWIDYEIHYRQLP